MLGVPSSSWEACNRIVVVCFFGVRAHEADRRAELALRSVCWERGRIVCDAYSASLWLRLADPGLHRGSVLPPVEVSPNRPEHALHAGAGGSSAYEVRIVGAEFLKGEHV
jgi:hypothetical protein